MHSTLYPNRKYTIGNRKSILVLGIGNVLRSDDGVGIHAIHAFEAEQIPEGVTIEDGGTGGFSLLDIIQGYDKIIVIDAMELGAPAGTVRELTVDDLSSIKSRLNEGTHGFNLSDMRALCETLNGVSPEITLIGVQPGTIDFSEHLSPEVEKSIARIRQIVLTEISQFTGEKEGQ